MSEYLSWHVGMKVVCVKEGGWAEAYGDSGRGRQRFPLYGEVLTIRELEVYNDNLWVRFVEIRNPVPDDRGPEASFHVTRFRPVQTRDTDIEIFERLLHSTNEKVGAS